VKKEVERERAKNKLEEGRRDSSVELEAKASIKR
jgi:hypothetical protein